MNLNLRTILISFVVTLICCFNSLHSYSQKEYPVTDNIFVIIDGEYPFGYQPKWTHVGTPTPMDFTWKYTIGKGYLKQQTFPFSLDEFQNKSVIRFKSFILCECVADIELHENKITLTNEPTKFKLKNFRKRDANSLGNSGEPCKGMQQSSGDWDGYIILSADNLGNITFDIYMQNYNVKGEKTHLYFANNKTILNAITPDIASKQAIATATKKQEDKQKAEIQEKKQAIRHELDLDYQRNIKTVKSRPAANTPTLTTYKGYSLKKAIDLEKLVGTNISKEDGVTEAYANAKSAYFRTIGGFSEQLSGNLSTIEPHKKDEQFAIRYCLVNALNEQAINIATYALIGDIAKLQQAASFLRNIENTSQINDMDKQNEIIGYLKSK